MSQHDRQIQPNDASVAAKVIDGEAIIMNLTSGAYYSMTGTGAAVWTLVEQGHTLSGIAAALSQAYQVPLTTVSSDVETLANELILESLVREIEDANGTGAAPTLDAAARESYVAPELNKYTDMQDLLALDPPMPSLGAITANDSSEK